MCNRYNSITRGPDIGLGLLRPCWVSPRLSEVSSTVFPGRTGAVLRLREDELGMDAMQWRLIPFWARDPLGADQAKFRNTYLARAETIATLPSYREPFKRRRCLVPIESFGDYGTVEGKRVPHLITPVGGGATYFPGVWDRWSRDGQEILGFAIVTAEAPPELHWINDRFPVLLNDEAARAWMDPAAHPDDLRAMLVSPTPEMIVAEAG